MEMWRGKGGEKRERVGEAVTLRGAADTHEGPVLDHLTANGAGTHEEAPRVAERLLGNPPEHRNLAVVPRVHLRKTCMYGFVWGCVRGVFVINQMNGARTQGGVERVRSNRKKRTATKGRERSGLRVCLCVYV